MADLTWIEELEALQAEYWDLENDDGSSEAAMHFTERGKEILAVLKAAAALVEQEPRESYLVHGYPEGEACVSCGKIVDIGAPLEHEPDCRYMAFVDAMRGEG